MLQAKLIELEGKKKKTNSLAFQTITKEGQRLLLFRAMEKNSRVTDLVKEGGVCETIFKPTGFENTFAFLTCWPECQGIGLALNRLP